MKRCECCQEECVDLFPVVNRDVAVVAGFAWVCAGCAEMEQDEYIDDLFRCPVDFELVKLERMRIAGSLQAVA